MDGPIGTISLETYTNLLVLYQDLILNLNKNNIIRKPVNHFYDYLDLILNSENGEFGINIKYYNLRNLLPTWQVLHQVFDVNHLYRLNISKNCETGLTVVSLCSLLKPLRDDIIINTVVIAIDITKVPHILFKSDQTFEIFLPQIFFKSTHVNTYFKTILRQPDNIDSNKVFINLSNDVDISSFHSILPFLLTDIEYLENNMALITNQIYCLLDYFAFTDHVEFIEDRCCKSRTVIYYLNFQIKDQDNAYFRYAYEDSISDKKLTELYADECLGLYRQACEGFLQTHKTKVVGRPDIENSLLILKKDLIIFRKLLFFLKVVQIYNGREEEQKIIPKCDSSPTKGEHLLDELIPDENSFSEWTGEKKQKIGLRVTLKFDPSSTEDEYLLDRLSRLSTDRDLFAEGTKERGLRSLIMAMSHYLNKFGQNSSIEEVLLLIDRFQASDNIYNAFLLEEGDDLPTTTTTTATIVYTKKFIVNVANQLLTFINIYEKSIEYHIKLLLTYTDQPFVQMELRELLQLKKHGYRFNVDNVGTNLYSLSSYDYWDISDNEISIDDYDEDQDDSND